MQKPYNYAKFTSQKNNIPKPQDQRTHRTPQPCMHTPTHTPQKTHRIATQTKHITANTPLAFARYRVTNTGLRQFQCGTPMLVVIFSPGYSPHLTLTCWSWTSLINIVSIGLCSSSVSPILFRSSNSVCLFTVSKAFDMSNKSSIIS